MCKYFRYFYSLLLLLISLTGSNFLFAQGSPTCSGSYAGVQWCSHAPDQGSVNHCTLVGGGQVPIGSCTYGDNQTSTRIGCYNACSCSQSNTVFTGGTCQCAEGATAQGGECVFAGSSSSSSSLPPPPPCAEKAGQTAAVAYSMVTGAPTCELSCDGNVLDEICIGDNCSGTFLWSGNQCELPGDGGGEGSSSSDSSSSAGSSESGGGSSEGGGAGSSSSAPSGGGECPHGMILVNQGDGVTYCRSEAQGDCGSGEFGFFDGSTYVCRAPCVSPTSWQIVNGVAGCYGPSPETGHQCGPNQVQQGEVNGNPICVGTCPAGQTWGSVYGAVGCYDFGQSSSAGSSSSLGQGSCPTGQTQQGTVNNNPICLPNCPTGFASGYVDGVHGCYDANGNLGAPGGDGGDGGAGGGGGGGSSAGSGPCNPSAKDYAKCIGSIGEASDDAADLIKQAFETAGRSKIDEAFTGYIDGIDNYSGIPSDFENAPSALENAVRGFLPDAATCSPITLELWGQTASMDCGFFNDFRVIFGWFLTIAAAIYIWQFSTAPINR